MLNTAPALQQIPGLWRGQQNHARFATVPTGHAALDQMLPNGGLPLGALTELLYSATGLGELSLWLPLLRTHSQRQQPVILIDPPCWPNPQALAAAGIQLPHLWCLRPPTPQHSLWAAEQLLKAGPGALVLLWNESADERCLRRLQLACEQGRTLAVLLRSSRWLSHNSCAAVRCLLETQAQTIWLMLCKCRGASRSGQRLRWSPRQQRLEWPDPHPPARVLHA